MPKWAQQQLDQLRTENINLRAASGGRPGPHPGRPREFKQIRLPVGDARLIEQAIGGLDLVTAMRRIAAAAAADLDATRAALAPLLAVDAWNEEVL